MKTEKELIRDIQTITAEIEKSYPELLKYLDEIPVKDSAVLGPGINRTHLKDYFDSLEALLRHYTSNHMPKTKIYSTPVYTL